MILPSARDCADVAVGGSQASNAYLILALSNIATALSTAGTYSCTLTTSGKAGADVQTVRQALINLGYALSQTTTTITISWANA